MFVDSAAIIAIICDEPEAQRCSTAIVTAGEALTSPIAVWEAVIALTRPDKLAVSGQVAEHLVLSLLECTGIVICNLPDAREVVSLSLEAARRYRTGALRLNLADCFHYACARHYQVPILSTGSEFRFTDVETVP